MTFDEALPVLLDGCMVQFAEAPTERDEILVGKALAREQQHLMIEPRRVNRSEDRVVDGAHIDPADLGAERGASRDHRDAANRGLKRYRVPRRSAHAVDLRMFAHRQLVVVAAGLLCRAYLTGLLCRAYLKGTGHRLDLERPLSDNPEI